MIRNCWAAGVSAAISPALFDKLNFNFIRDIAPVAGILRVPNLVSVTPSLPVETIPQLIAYAKANPGKLNFGAPTAGTILLAGELFKMMPGVNIVHVPYGGGGGQAITDLLAGRMQVSFDIMPATIEYVRAAMASSGSKGLERPRQFAVAGMNCATPCAPARLTAAGSNRLSCQISRVKKSVGRSFCAAAAASALQIVSVDTGCGGVWLPSAAPVSSDSAALACFARPTKTNRARTTADPARLRMFLPAQRSLCARIITAPLPPFHAS